MRNLRKPIIWVALFGVICVGVVVWGRYNTPQATSSTPMISQVEQDVTVEESTKAPVRRQMSVVPSAYKPEPSDVEKRLNAFGLTAVGSHPITVTQ